MSRDEIDLRSKYLLGMIEGLDSRKAVIDHQKDQFALEIAGQVMERIKSGRFLMPECQIKAHVQLLILDAIEFGIQLGGMDWKEGE